MVLLLLVSAITMFISAAVDFPPTALRAVRFGNLLFAVLALAGTAATARSSCPPTVYRVRIFERDRALLAAPDLVDLNCTRLC